MPLARMALVEEERFNGGCCCCCCNTDGNALGPLLKSRERVFISGRAVEVESRLASGSLADCDGLRPLNEEERLLTELVLLVAYR